MNNLFIALMYGSVKKKDKAIEKLTAKFGKINYYSEEYPFNFTDYYEREFGKDLKKQLFIFNKAIEKNDLIDIRNTTEEIEQSFSENGNRTINIDPGYISETGLVLATKKEKPWKELLGQGIYAHKIMECKEKQIVTFNHTFADYRSAKVKEFLNAHILLL